MFPATKPFEASMTTKKKKGKKRNFSSFSYADAYQQLGIKKIEPWAINALPQAPSEFFNQRMKRLAELFDLSNYEESKKLIIDAICEEAIYGLDYLKIWKGAKIESDCLTGHADYVVAERKDYFDRPLLCVIEAKKDDFEQGLAQCLVEMQACQWQNRQIDGHTEPIASDTDTFGIISNGSTWRFCKLISNGKVCQTGDYSTTIMDVLLGQLRYVFMECNQIMIDRENFKSVGK
jgi:hypothetical protein